MFEISNLRFKEILKIDHLVIDKQVTCIVGASGSGKTTLLRHLNGMAKPDFGSVRYNGQDIAAIPGVTLRRRVVMLGQTPILYEGNIADNLQIGLEFSQKPLAPVQRLLEIMKLVGLAKNLEDGCSTLSGGEKQRICLARVMLMDAETYLLDEPSAALDKETELFVIENLVEFAKSGGKQLVMVTHSEKIAELYKDSVIPMENGRIGGGGYA